MKIKSEKTTKQIILQIIIPVLIVTTGIVVSILIVTKDDEPDESFCGTTQLEQSKQDDLDAKKDFIDSQNDDNNNEEDDTTLPTPISITKLSAQKEQNNTVTILTSLLNITKGECKLSITNGSNNYAKTVNILYQSEYSLCAGFSVPINDLGPGKWQISLEVTSFDNNKQTKSMTYEVSK
jgi:hypothetical protein